MSVSHQLLVLCCDLFRYDEMKMIYDIYLSYLIYRRTDVEDPKSYEMIYDICLSYIIYRRTDVENPKSYVMIYDIYRSYIIQTDRCKESQRSGPVPPLPLFPVIMTSPDIYNDDISYQNSLHKIVVRKASIKISRVQ